MRPVHGSVSRFFAAGLLALHIVFDISQYMSSYIGSTSPPQNMAYHELSATQVIEEVGAVEDALSAPKDRHLALKAASHVPGCVPPSGFGVVMSCTGKNDIDLIRPGIALMLGIACMSLAPLRPAQC